LEISACYKWEYWNTGIVEYWENGLNPFLGCFIIDPSFQNSNIPLCQTKNDSPAMPGLAGSCSAVKTLLSRAGPFQESRRAIFIN
jgi:hypothetical protein